MKTKGVIILLLTLMGVATAARSQKLIEYTSGMGSRDPQRPSVWILYKDVVATHEGMTLYADSAHYDTELNSFTAFRDIVIRLSDTTTIYGDRLFYDGNTRVIDIWADTVVLIDGGNVLKANHLTYERNTSTGSCSYPLVKVRIHFATRSGVLSNPSRWVSSPTTLSVWVIHAFSSSISFCLSSNDSLYMSSVMNQFVPCLACREPGPHD